MSEDNTSEELTAPPKAKKLKTLDNNNIFWSLNEVLDLSDSEDLGVELLSPPQDVSEDNNEACDDSGFGAEQPSLSLKLKLPFLRKRIINKGAYCGRDMFSTLSDEIILVILKLLPHSVLGVVAQVSKRFNSLAKDDSLWPRMDKAGRTIRQDTLGYIITRGTKVLRLAGAHVLSPAFVETVSLLENFHCKLEYLDLSEAIISSEDLANLLSKCHSLKKLSLEGCELDDKVCQAISSNEKLDTLNLCKTTGLTAEGIEAICTHCLRLNSVNIAWSGMPYEAVRAFCHKVNNKLTHLNMSGCQSTLLDEDAVVLIEKSKDLVELDVSDCLEVTSKLIAAVVTNLSKLESISISRCYKLTVPVFLSLIEMPQLERINAFRNLSQGHIKVLEKKLPRLKFNAEPFSTIARPTVGERRTSIWEIRCRE